MAVAEKPRPITKADQGRCFEVVVRQVGPWKEKHVFSEYEFRRIHPVPVAAFGDEPIDPEEYYQAALDRLLTAEDARTVSIKQVYDRKPMPTELGPGSEPPKRFASPATAQITNSVLEHLAAQSAKK